MTPQRGLGAVRNLDYTMLLCGDIAPMRAFYGDVLALRLQREVPGRYLEFAVGAGVLAIRLRGREYDGPPRDVDGAGVQLAFRVSPGDVDACAQQLAERGVSLLEPIRHFADFGHRALFVADPEHNIVEIYAEV